MEKGIMSNKREAVNVTVTTIKTTYQQFEEGTPRSDMYKIARISHENSNGIYTESIEIGESFDPAEF